MLDVGFESAPSLVEGALLIFSYRHTLASFPQRSVLNLLFDGLASPFRIHGALRRPIALACSVNKLPVALKFNDAVKA